MYKKSLIALLWYMSFTCDSQAFNSPFFSDTSLAKMQGRIDAMRKQFDKIQKEIIEQYESQVALNKDTQAPLYTIQDTNNTIAITLSIGDIETDMIENHLENGALVIELPKDKPSLRITVYPNNIVISGKKVVEKKQTTENDTTTSHVVSAQSVHVEEALPATVITTKDVSIVHSADDGKLTIELPKKVHQQQFSITRK